MRLMLMKMEYLFLVAKAKPLAPKKTESSPLEQSPDIKPSNAQVKNKTTPGKGELADTNSNSRESNS